MREIKKKLAKHPDGVVTANFSMVNVTLDVLEDLEENRGYLLIKYRNHYDYSTLNQGTEPSLLQQTRFVYAKDAAYVHITNNFTIPFTWPPKDLSNPLNLRKLLELCDKRDEGPPLTRSQRRRRAKREGHAKEAAKHAAPTTSTNATPTQDINEPSTSPRQ